MHTAGCVRNLGMVLMSCTVLALFYMLLVSGGARDAAHPKEFAVPSQPEFRVPANANPPPTQEKTKVPEVVAAPTQAAPPPSPPPPPPPPAPPAVPTPASSTTASGQKKGNILVVLPKDHRTGGDFGFREGGWLERAIENRQDYAEAHGYKFIWEDLSTYHPEYDIDACWAKIAALQHSFEAHPDVEWIWMLDADAIIMNPDIDLYDHVLADDVLKRIVRTNFEVKIPGGAKIDAQKPHVFTPSEVIPEEIYLVIAADGNGINAGSFFIRRTAFMSAMIDFWRDPYLMKAGFGYREQDALAHLIITHKQVLKHTAVIPQKLINEYVDRLQPDDFVVHFAGCSFYKERDCDKLFKEHWEKAKKPKGKSKYD